MKKILLGSLAWVCLLPSVVFAINLDENCSVNIMNRTVQAQADGSWRLANVPSFMGQVRARATCVRDGVTSSGQSEFFRVQTNTFGLVEDIFFDNPSPVPVTLSFAQSEPVVLQDISESLLLSARANFSDGTFSPLLNATNGINFTSSNSAIVSVDNNGLLTPLSSGRALITARLEGATAFQQVTVSLSGDSDGDGLPDSYEIANGLDPNDPVDAREDIDRDGLTALAEFTSGTNVNSADSDNDGISDGEELIAGSDGFITNPLLADTDGDGFSDGLEIELATDPVDNLSFNLAQALESIIVEPSRLDLVFNGVDTEVSSPITVLGRLIDGREIDITSSDFGTSYSSADLTIASFGINSGEIFGGVAGSTTITISNNGLSENISVGVERFDPLALSAIDIPGYANNVDVQGDYAYVAAGEAGLVVVDVSDRTAPFIAAQLDTNGTAVDIKASGNIIYLADGAMGIKIINIQNPLLPVLISDVDTEDFALDIDFDNNYLYVADSNGGLVIINITQAEEPFIQSVLKGFQRINGVAVDGNRVVLSSVNGLQLIDVTSRKEPIQISGLGIRGVRDIFFQDDYVYVAARTSGYGVVNVADFSNPIIVAGDIFNNRAASFVPRDVVKQEGLVLFAEQLFANAIPFVNASDPEQAEFQGTIDLSALGDYAGTGIAADNQFVYATEEFFVVNNDFGILANTRLFIAQYRQVIDTLGAAPSVNFIEPLASTMLNQGELLTVVVDAVDDVSVREVEFFINGNQVFIDRSEPYRLQFLVDLNASEVEVIARAVDWGNNISETSITYSVIVDTDRDGLSDDDEINIYNTSPNDQDSDQDGLTDFREVLLGTNPNAEDSDADILLDSDELRLGSNPLLADTDNDGLSDGQEQLGVTNLLIADTDGDGLNDGDEQVYNTNAIVNDSDADGLSDGDEIFIYFTQATNSDSDGDGVPDGNEVAIGSDPNNIELDVDGDGIPNDREVELGLDPGNSDSDGDNLSDGAELNNRTNPLKFDTDNDGIDDGNDRVNDWLYFLENDLSSESWFGLSTENVGDINNDGINDLAVAGNRSVQVFSGRNSRLLRTITYEDRGLVANSLDNIGDINKDGYDDTIIVGNRGLVDIMSGIDGSVLNSLNLSPTGVTVTVAGVGDINGDNIPDIVVGDAGRDVVEVLSGADFTVLFVLTERFGFGPDSPSVATSGDVNNDGINDILVGSPARDRRSTGTARVYSGADGTLLYRFQSSSEFGVPIHRFGSSVSSAGDVNNDGFADFVVGGSGYGATVFSGVNGSILHRFIDPLLREFGSVVRGGGDINNDGFNDIVVSSIAGSGVRENGIIVFGVAAVVAFSGVDGSILYRLNPYGDVSRNRFGETLTFLGDIDNDGYDDIAVSNPEFSFQSVRIVSSNADWDNDGVNTLEDPFPLDPER